MMQRNFHTDMFCCSINFFNFDLVLLALFFLIVGLVFLLVGVVYFGAIFVVVIFAI